MCTNLDLYRIYACIFNSLKICAQVPYCIGFVPAYSILAGYVHKFCIPFFWLVWRFYACMFNSRRICAQILCFDFDWNVACTCMFNSWWICPEWKIHLEWWKTHWEVCLLRIVLVTHEGVLLVCSSLGKELLEKHMFVSHTKHMQWKINGSTSFAIDNMYYINFRI